MVKSYIVLKMYDELRKGRKIDLRAWCDICKISLPTFRRHIAFLRGYLMETHGVDLIYDRSISGDARRRPHLRPFHLGIQA